MPAGQRSQLQVVQGIDLKKQRRRHRRPQHDFFVNHQPYSIKPFFIAPILPGETLNELLLQSRAMTDPINNPFCGWWLEHYFFFVPWRGMPDFAATMKAMALDPTTSTAALKASANEASAFYTFKGGMDFVRECLEVVVERFFRDEGESWTASLDPLSLPKAIVDQSRWLHSLKLASATGDDTDLPGQDELEELDILPGFTNHYAQWEIMRDLNVTDLTFEDWLRSEGVNVPDEDIKTGVPQDDFKPELIRFSRDWKYPSMAIDPTDGSSANRVQWSIAERADKRRFFKEPGFLFGVSVLRPKVYFGNQMGAAVGHMDSIFNWLPALLQGHEYTGLKEVAFSATDGILQNQASNYWFDFADLLEFGDQFTTGTGSVINQYAHRVDLPTAAMEKRYVSQANIEAFFVNGTDAGGGLRYVRQDGRVSLDILSRVRQTT